MATRNDSDYGLINRLNKLRDLLEDGGEDKEYIRRLVYGVKEKNISRQLQRDIRALRAFGDEVIYERKTQTYRLLPKPHLALTDDDVETLSILRQSFTADVPIAHEAQNVFVKIAEAMTEAQRLKFYRPPPLAVNIKPATDYRPHQHKIHALQKLIAERQVIAFTYHPVRQNKVTRQKHFEPYEVQFFDRHFYLIGYSQDYNHTLEFRIDRIEDIERLPQKFGGKKAERLSPFKYRLGSQVARLGVSERFPKQQLLAYIDGDAIVIAEGYSDFRIIRGLLHYGDQAELLEPPDLRAKMRELVEKMWKLYQSDK